MQRFFRRTDRLWRTIVGRSRLGRSRSAARNKKPRPVNSGRGALFETMAEPSAKWRISLRASRGIVLRIGPLGGGHTIVVSRGWLNACVFGFRLAWLSPFPLFVSVVRVPLHSQAMPERSCYTAIRKTWQTPPTNRRKSLAAKPVGTSGPSKCNRESESPHSPGGSTEACIC
jgi:hypothetical protein